MFLKGYVQVTMKSNVKFHSVKMCETLLLKGYVQVVMKSNVKVCKLLFLEAFVKITMKFRLWWWIRKIKWKIYKKIMNFDKNGD